MSMRSYVKFGDVCTICHITGYRTESTELPAGDGVTRCCFFPLSCQKVTTLTQVHADEQQ